MTEGTWHMRTGGLQPSVLARKGNKPPSPPPPAQHWGSAPALCV